MAAVVIPFPRPRVSPFYSERERIAREKLAKIERDWVVAKVGMAFKDYWQEELRRAMRGQPQLPFEA